MELLDGGRSSPPPGEHIGSPSAQSPLRKWGGVVCVRDSPRPPPRWDATPAPGQRGAEGASHRPPDGAGGNSPPPSLGPLDSGYRWGRGKVPSSIRLARDEDWAGSFSQPRVYFCGCFVRLGGGPEGFNTQGYRQRVYVGIHTRLQRKRPKHPGISNSDTGICSVVGGGGSPTSGATEGC